MGAGQLQREGRAWNAIFAVGRAHMNAAAVALDDLLGDPEAEAGADIFLGGEERLEDAVKIFGRYAGTAVGDYDFDGAVLFIGNKARADDDGAIGSGGIDGIGDYVREDLRSSPATPKTGGHWPKLHSA